MASWWRWLIWGDGPDNRGAAPAAPTAPPVPDGPASAPAPALAATGATGDGERHARPTRPAPRPRRPVTSGPYVRALAGGRVTMDNPSSARRAGGAGGQASVIAPPDWSTMWRAEDWDSQTLERTDPVQLLTAMATLSPELSDALWYFQRLANPGWSATALIPGTTEPHAAGQVALDQILAQLGQAAGAIDIPINRLFLGAYIRGALFVELVLDPRGRLALELATPDPATARFRPRDDPERGTVLELGQMVAGKFQSVERPTVRYLPIDPFPGSPYGRPLVGAALFPCLTLLSMLHDLRRVISQQGWPRIAIEIDAEAAARLMPDEVAADPDQHLAWFQALIEEIRATYAALQPDQAYVHLNAIRINRPVGSLDQASLGSVAPLIQALERVAVRSLKMMPLLLGITDAVSEANANRQWEMLVASIKAIQHLVETTLQDVLGLALEAQGIQASVRWRFAEVRAAELLRDAQVADLQTRTTLLQYWAGWISQEEAAARVVGHAPDQVEPRDPAAALAPAGAGASVNPEPGSARGLSPDGDARATRQGRIGSARRGVTPAGASDPLPDLVAATEPDDDDLEATAEAWDALMPRRYRGLLSATLADDDDDDRAATPSAARSNGAGGHHRLGAWEGVD